MLLYHYTAAQTLRAIGEYGLTIGDVPTDRTRNAGRVGVWLTTSPHPQHQGLEHSALDKTAYRLCVELPCDAPKLHRWVEWAQQYVTDHTRHALQLTATGYDTWWVYFGWIEPDAIIECVRTVDQHVIEHWPTYWPADDSHEGISYYRRHVWHHRLLQHVARHNTSPPLIRAQTVRLSDKVSIAIRPTSRSALFWIMAEGYTAPLHTLRNARNERYVQVMTDSEVMQINERGEITIIDGDQVNG